MTDFPCTSPKPGTRAGYRRHQRHGEIACDACLAAEREYQRQRKTEGRAERHLDAAHEPNPTTGRSAQTW